MKRRKKHQLGLALLIIGTLLMVFDFPTDDSAAWQITFLVVPAGLFIAGLYLLNTRESK